MKGNIIILCAVNLCTGMVGAEATVQISESCVIEPQTPCFPLVKMNFEGILVNEPEEKRRVATRTGTKNKSRFQCYGHRAASPCPSKASLKKRNKRR